MKVLHKTCVDCNLEKEITEFHKKHKGKYGVNSKCKSCVILWSAEYRSKIEHTEVKEKQCSSCLETKDVELFSKRKDSLDGRKGVCNKCISIRSAKKEGREYIDKRQLKQDGLRKCKSCGDKKEISLFLERSAICKNCIKVSDKIEVKNKHCSRCKQVLKPNMFSKSSYSKDGIAHNCKPCMKTFTDKLNYVRVSEGEKECNVCGKLAEFSEYHSSKNNKDGLTNSCKECSIDRVHLWKNENKERVKSYAKELLIKNPLYRKKQYVRSLIANSIRRACNGKYRKSKKTEDILGCSLVDFLAHLETLFQEGMTWENRGACVRGNCHEFWHVDHKIPLATAKTEEEVYLLNHYTNLQPMWANENLSKGKKIDYEQ